MGGGLARQTACTHIKCVCVCVCMCVAVCARVCVRVCVCTHCALERVLGGSQEEGGRGAETPSGGEPLFSDRGCSEVEKEREVETPSGGELWQRLFSGRGLDREKEIEV